MADVNSRTEKLVDWGWGGKRCIVKWKLEKSGIYTIKSMYIHLFFGGLHSKRLEIDGFSF